MKVSLGNKFHRYRALLHMTVAAGALCEYNEICGDTLQKQSKVVCYYTVTLSIEVSPIGL